MNFSGSAMSGIVAVILGLAFVGALALWLRERGTTRVLEEKLRLQEDARETMAEYLRAQAAQSAGAVAEELVKRADESFRNREQLAQARLEAQLKPVAETLAKFEQQVQAIEKTRAEEQGGLKRQIQELLQASAATQEEARKLSSALKRAPGVQGRWGEQMLRNVLELSGLRHGVDFEEQFHVGGDEGASRPDVVVRLPGSAYLVIDSKVSLNDYQASLEAQDEVSREACLKAHADSLRRHVAQLSSKAYWAKFDKPPKSRSPEVVVMFVPLESAFACAMERSPEIVADAWERRVAIVTPAALFPLLRAVAYGWRAEDQAANAREIADAGRELHKRVSVIAKYAADLGNALNKAVGSYNEFTSSLERNVLTQAKRFEALAAQSERTIADVPMLDSHARPLVKLIESDQEPGLTVVEGAPTSAA